MRRLTTVDDDVSRRVRQQYEENPYPRWIKLPDAGKTLSLDAYLREQFPAVPFIPLGKDGDLDILVAGCGTGQESIEMAQQFPAARVLAVDLSLSSLAYAQRKTAERGITNIEYAQADITKLASIGRTFDIISSVGVLHHLEDPMAGWRQLLSLLRPGGFMLLGFYSERARQNIVAARAFIADGGYGSTAAEIRRCREALTAPGEPAEVRATDVVPGFLHDERNPRPPVSRPGASLHAAADQGAARANSASTSSDSWSSRRSCASTTSAFPTTRPGPISTTGTRSRPSSPTRSSARTRSGRRSPRPSAASPAATRWRCARCRLA